MTAPPGILIARERISRGELERLVRLYFGDMVKFVADVERAVAAVGGELHSDAEAMLLEAGSRQDDLWGGNYLPGRGEDGCIEYTSLINIRPARGNRGMLVQDALVRQKMRAIIFDLIGRGEPLP